jgi:hypothetical protein
MWPQGLVPEATDSRQTERNAELTCARDTT